MLKPSLIEPHQARRFGVAPGWWAVDEAGRPILGPHCSRERVLMQIGFEQAAGRLPALPPRRRQLVNSYATHTAEAALARRDVVQIYRRRVWAVFGLMAGGLGLIGLQLDGLSIAAGALLCAIGLGSAVWLASDGASLRQTLARAEAREEEARAARRRLDLFHDEGQRKP